MVNTSTERSRQTASVRIKVYTTQSCQYCEAAKRLLRQLGLNFEEVGLDQNPELRQRLSEEQGGWRTVPMIFIDDQFIGGFTELSALHKQGKLNRLQDTHKT